MRKALLILGLTIAVGTTAYVSPNIASSAWAQACQNTCTNAESICKRRSSAPDCAAAYKKCLKTGTFTGPKSGSTFTNLCKS